MHIDEKDIPSMCINDWSKITPTEVHRAVEKHHSGADLTKREDELVTRWGDIRFFIGDRCIFATSQPALLGPLEEVLTRLPFDDLMEIVYGGSIHIVFPERNVNHFEWLTPAHTDRFPNGIGMIILSQTLHEKPHAYRVGIIVHEIAHALRCDKAGGKQVEDETDALAISWGFGAEIALTLKKLDSEAPAT